MPRTEPLDYRIKGLPPAAEGAAPGALGRLGLRLLSGDLMMPAALLLEDALRHNIAAMQAFAEREGALLCPHGKTSMSPELFAMQLAAGAWGLTAATAHQVRIYRQLGIGRIFLANQPVARTDIEFLVTEIDHDPGFDFYCLADSMEGVSRIAAAAAARRLTRPVQILVEIGLAGARSGVRTVDEALALARVIRASAPWLSLRGVETFEGVRQRAEGRPEARAMLALAVAAAQAAAAAGLFGEGDLLLSAGGSSYLDLCAAALPAVIGDHPVKRVFRPGCYVTHDSGLYERITRPDGVTRPGLPDLRNAIEIWGVVQSVPEPGLAIVGVGKRDVSFDVEPPIPLWWSREGGRPERAAGLGVLHLWDQHLSLASEPGRLRVGDLVGFGISHPCATFDRWRALFTVDEAYCVTGAVTTLF